MRYSIADVARLAKASPATVRAWEREGLLRPSRTPGGHRVYTDQDLERIRRILFLRRVGKLNAAGIKRELGSPAPTLRSPTDPVTATDPALGPRLRSTRLARALSLADVAATTGLSVSFLSAVELGQSGISLVNLYKLAEAYGITIATLQNPGLSPQAPRRVLVPGERPRYSVDDGRVVVEDLIEETGRLRATLLEIAPGGESGDAYEHAGEEFVYVLSGHVAFWVDETDYYELHASQSFHLVSSRPHRWKNIGNGFASLLWVNMSPS
jgi:transcriptional regulator with XRE-family HTH domain